MLPDTYNKTIYCKPCGKNTPAITNMQPARPLLYMKWEDPHEYHPDRYRRRYRLRQNHPYPASDGPEVTVIGHDNYYKRQDGKTLEERAKVNYDHPAAFNTELLIEHLKELKEGHPIRCPVYSYVDHNRTEETREILPTKVIIVEGILIFQNPTLRDMFDIKIFVETDADVRILRRALRDVEERGRTLQSVVTQYLTTVKPMHEQYVEPSRKFADIIVLEGGRNLVALEMIMQRIRAHIDTP